MALLVATSLACQGLAFRPSVPRTVVGTVVTRSRYVTMSDVVPKRILVTGAGSGLGKAAAVELGKRGHTVFASVRNAKQKEELEALGLNSLELDVTSPEGHKAAAALELDVLVNNAGAGFSGSMAEMDIEMIKKNFDINVFSTLALTQEVLKGMIAKEKGTVVFVNSMAGRMTFPFMGAYCATKHAQQAVAEALRAEMDNLGKGIQVTIVEPGPYNTGFNDAMMDVKYAKMYEESYWTKEQVDALKQADIEQLDEVDELDDIVAKYVEACESERPAQRYCAPIWHFENILKPIEKERSFDAGD